jgi:cardiolipin synthase
MDNCEYLLYILEQKNTNKTSNVIPYLDGLEYEEDIGKSVYTNMIASAREKIYIMTPYFIVDHTIENLLISKAMCGADVRIVLPRIPDKKIVYSLSSANARKLTEKGVKVYLMDGSFVHSKLLLTENEVAVGSVNMDMRSFYQQFECGVVTTDSEVMADIEADFTETFSLCTDIREVVKYNFLVKRIYNGLLRLFSPLM